MQTNLETIEKYIDGELKGQELLEFENLLSTDPDIKSEYELSMQINQSVMEDDVMALRETMEYMYEDDTKVQRTPNLFTRRKFYYAAASAALLIAAGGIVQKMSNPNLSSDAVFDKYYEPYDVTVTYRSGNTEVDRVLLNALEQYEEQDYEQALQLFEKVLDKGKSNMALNLYSGIAYLEEEKYQKAKTSFSYIMSDKDNLFIEQAEWYLSMCYLKTEKRDKARLVLNKIIERESYYKDQAKDVLKDLRN